MFGPWLMYKNTSMLLMEGACVYTRVRTAIGPQSVYTHSSLGDQVGEAP